MKQSKKKKGNIMQLPALEANANKSVPQSKKTIMVNEILEKMERRGDAPWLKK